MRLMSSSPAPRPRGFPSMGVVFAGFPGSSDSWVAPYHVRSRCPAAWFPAVFPWYHDAIGAPAPTARGSLAPPSLGVEVDHVGARLALGDRPRQRGDECPVTGRERQPRGFRKRPAERVGVPIAWAKMWASGALVVHRRAPSRIAIQLFLRGSCIVVRAPFGFESRWGRLYLAASTLVWPTARPIGGPR